MIPRSASEIGFVVCFLLSPAFLSESTANSTRRSHVLNASLPRLQSITSKVAIIQENTDVAKINDKLTNNDDGKTNINSSEDDEDTDGDLKPDKAAVVSAEGHSQQGDARSRRQRTRLTSRAGPSDRLRRRRIATAIKTYMRSKRLTLSDLDHLTRLRLRRLYAAAPPQLEGTRRKRKRRRRKKRRKKKKSSTSSTERGGEKLAAGTISSAAVKNSSSALPQKPLLGVTTSSPPGAGKLPPRTVFHEAEPFAKAPERPGERIAAKHSKPQSGETRLAGAIQSSARRQPKGRKLPPEITPYKAAAREDGSKLESKATTADANAFGPNDKPERKVSFAKETKPKTAKPVQGALGTSAGDIRASAKETSSAPDHHSGVLVGEEGSAYFGTADKPGKTHSRTEPHDGAHEARIEALVSVVDHYSDELSEHEKILNQIIKNTERAEDMLKSQKMSPQNHKSGGTEEDGKQPERPTAEKPASEIHLLATKGHSAEDAGQSATGSRRDKENKRLQHAGKVTSAEARVSGLRGELQKHKPTNDKHIADKFRELYGSATVISSEDGADGYSSEQRPASLERQNKVKRLKHPTVVSSDTNSSSFQGTSDRRQSSRFLDPELTKSNTNTRNNAGQKSSAVDVSLDTGAQGTSPELLTNRANRTLETTNAREETAGSFSKIPQDRRKISMRKGSHVRQRPGVLNPNPDAERRAQALATRKMHRTEGPAQHGPGKTATEAGTDVTDSNHVVPAWDTDKKKNVKDSSAEIGVETTHWTHGSRKELTHTPDKHPAAHIQVLKKEMSETKQPSTSPDDDNRGRTQDRRVSEHESAGVNILEHSDRHSAQVTNADTTKSLRPPAPANNKDIAANVFGHPLHATDGVNYLRNTGQVSEKENKISTNDAVYRPNQQGGASNGRPASTHKSVQAADSRVSSSVENGHNHAKGTAADTSKHAGTPDGQLRDAVPIAGTSEKIKDLREKLQPIAGIPANDVADPHQQTDAAEIQHSSAKDIDKVSGLRQKLPPSVMIQANDVSNGPDQRGSHTTNADTSKNVFHRLGQAWGLRPIGRTLANSLPDAAFAQTTAVKETPHDDGPSSVVQTAEPQAAIIGTSLEALPASSGIQSTAAVIGTENPTHTGHLRHQVSQAFRKSDPGHPDAGQVKKDDDIPVVVNKGDLTQQSKQTKSTLRPLVQSTGQLMNVEHISQKSTENSHLRNVMKEESSRQISSDSDVKTAMDSFVGSTLMEAPYVPNLSAQGKSPKQMDDKIKGNFPHNSFHGISRNLVQNAFQRGDNQPSGEYSSSRHSNINPNIPPKTKFNDRFSAHHSPSAFSEFRQSSPRETATISTKALQDKVISLLLRRKLLLPVPKETLLHGQREGIAPQVATIGGIASPASIHKAVQPLPLRKSLAPVPTVASGPLNGSSALVIVHSTSVQRRSDGQPLEMGDNSTIWQTLSSFPEDFLTSKWFLTSVGVSVTLLLFCIFLCICGGTRWYRHHKYRQAFNKLEESFSGLDTNRPIFLRLSQLRRCKAGNQYVVTVLGDFERDDRGVSSWRFRERSPQLLDDSKFSVVDHDLESEDEIFDVTDIKTADKKGPLARLQWTNPRTPY